jgi:hypothetical protein
MSAAHGRNECVPVDRIRALVDALGLKPARPDKHHEIPTGKVAVLSELLALARRTNDFKVAIQAAKAIPLLLGFVDSGPQPLREISAQASRLRCC